MVLNPLWYLFFFSLSSISGLDYNTFDDSVKFEVTWPGKLKSEDFSESSDTEAPSVEGEKEEVTQLLTTLDNELYKCLLPDQLLKGDEESETSNDALLPQALLEPLLSSGDCTMLIDGYWTYEVCYGKQLRQFHEEKTQESPKVLEYNLGKFNKVQGSPPPHPPPTWPYLNDDYPYYEVILTDGSPCDIRDNVGRTTKLMIICDPDHRPLSSLVNVKEASTCEYEAVIATKLLCKNKAYRVKVDPVHSIQCHPVNDAPTKPLRLHHHESSMKDISFSKDSVPLFQQPLSNNKASGDTSKSGGGMARGNFDAQLPQDNTFVANFLSGSTCILGSFTTWWQYELCFKGYVRQFHKEGGIVRQTVTLGVWSEKAHKAWFSRMGKGKQSANHVVHLYVNGDVCDITGEPRKTRVKFRCAKKTNSHNQVAISLEEPTPCNYLLTIDAGFICGLLKSTDEYGMFVANPPSSHPNSQL